jgi:hypothetical protein
VDDSKAIRNLQYLQSIERKKIMGRLIDPMGLPAGNNHPQMRPQPQIDPVLQMLWPLHCQALHDIMAQPEWTGNADDSVNMAWDIANKSLEKFGFKFNFSPKEEVAKEGGLQL